MKITARKAKPKTIRDAWVTNFSSRNFMYEIFIGKTATLLYCFKEITKFITAF